MSTDSQTPADPDVSQAADPIPPHTKNYEATAAPPRHAATHKAQRRPMTREEMEKFLRWLAPPGAEGATAEEAGRRYREIHHCLTAIYIRRGYANAEDMADEAIDRVWQRVLRDDSFDGGDRLPYFVRVAYNLHIEWHNKKPLALSPPPPPDAEADPELEDRCLHECLQRLAPDQRQLLLRYYSDNKQAKIDCRRQLAQELGLAIELLRLKIHRLRARLRPCLEQCLGRASGPLAH